MMMMVEKKTPSSNNKLLVVSMSIYDIPRGIIWSNINRLWINQSLMFV